MYKKFFLISIFLCAWNMFAQDYVNLPKEIVSLYLQTAKEVRLDEQCFQLEPGLILCMNVQKNELAIRATFKYMPKELEQNKYNDFLKTGLINKLRMNFDLDFKEHIDFLSIEELITRVRERNRADTTITNDGQVTIAGTLSIEEFDALQKNILEKQKKQFGNGAVMEKFTQEEKIIRNDVLDYWGDPLMQTNPNQNALLFGCGQHIAPWPWYSHADEYNATIYPKCKEVMKFLIAQRKIHQEISSVSEKLCNEAVYAHEQRHAYENRAKNSN